MKLNALVVDDSRIMRKMVMQALEGSRLGEFEFTEAEDGRDALDKLDPKVTDVVFADWNMPNMDGLAFARAVRATQRTEHIPIVMVTSEKTMGKMEVALAKGGASAYICKPFTPDDMRVRLGKLIQQVAERRARAEKPGGFFSKLLSG